LEFAFFDEKHGRLPGRLLKLAVARRYDSLSAVSSPRLDDMLFISEQVQGCD